MKVKLIAINSKYIHSNLAIRYLKAYTNQINYDCELIEFSINDRVERIVEEIILTRPDIIVLSCYIWNVEYVAAVSKLIKLIDSSIEIVYGGPEVSYDGRTFLEENVGDYLIEGEGEVTFKEFINFKLGECSDINVIKGLYHKSEGNVIYNGSRELMDMNDIVFPYYEDENLNNKIVYYEGSRGCPFKCKYCLSSTVHGVRFLDVERVKKELKFFIDKKVRLIKFVDRTFNCNSRFAMEIWKFLIDTPSETAFHFEISADILKPEELEILAKAPKGKFQFEVGVQTTNNTVLRNINRFVNFEHIKEKVDELMELNNIKQHLDLIAGLPGEDYESFRKSFNDVYAIKPEEIQLGFLKLLKGSSMRDEADKWGMVYSPYPPYEILKTKDISYDELLKLKKVEKMVDKYYNSQKFNNILNYFTKKYDLPFDFYYDLGGFFAEKGYFSRNISSVDYYKVFLEFNEEFLKESNTILAEVVKYDYLKYNKKKWLPEFLNRDISKGAEKQIKDSLIERDIIRNGNDVHIEKFNININQYINDGIVSNDELYLAYDLSDEERILDVGKYIS